MPDQRSLTLDGKGGLRHDHRHIQSRHPASFVGRENDLEKGAPLSQQDRISTAPAAGQTGTAPSSQPAPAPANAPMSRLSPALRGSWRRLALPLFPVLAPFRFIPLPPLPWHPSAHSPSLQT